MEALQLAEATSPTRSAQEGLRRMSLNSPPSHTDNPRQIKRAKLLGGERGNPPAYGDEAKEALRNNRGNFFHAPVPPQQKEQRQQPDETPMKQRMQPYNPRAALEAPSPMPTWGGRKVKAMALRDASYGEELEASDPSSFYPSFEREGLRQPYDGGSRTSGDEAANGDDSGDGVNTHMPSSTATSTSTPPRPLSYARSIAAGHGGGDGDFASATTMDADESYTSPATPATIEADRLGGGADVRQGAAAASTGSPLSRVEDGAVPDTPMTRPRSAIALGGGEGRGKGGGARSGSCSPVGSESGSGVGSPVKKRGVGRWRLSDGGGRTRGDGFGESPPPINRNSLCPRVDAKSMPAPPPRSTRPSLSSLSSVRGGESRSGADGDSDSAAGSPMDMSHTTDFGATHAVQSSGRKGSDSSFLRRVSTGSCASTSSSRGDVGRGMALDKKDISEPSPCDVTAFVPVTPNRPGFIGMGTPASAAVGVLARNQALMSPSSVEGGEMYMPAGSRTRTGGGQGQGQDCLGEKVRGRFASDFEELSIIGFGRFGMVYEVQSRLDGCRYAVKCTRRRFRGEADRQNMLREVYALAAVSAQEDTINIVRYHQAWIEDERLYIQTELCETSLEKQLEKGQQLDIPGVYAFLRQTLLGLEILHQHNLVHLDIKPGNIFVKNGQYKLGDFGLVTPVHVRSGADVVEGDSRYMSKELLNDDHSNLTKCDVFSLGITLYEIITARPLPPNGEEWHILRSGRVNRPMGVPDDLCRILNEMMHSEPSRRPAAAELLRYPCLQSEMERQLNDQRSKLNKERTHNQALKEEMSALIQKKSHRSGRLSRTVTWDNSYFSQRDSNLTARRFEGGRPSLTSIRNTRLTTTSMTTTDSASQVPTPPDTASSSADHGASAVKPFFSSTGLFGAGSAVPRFGAATVATNDVLGSVCGVSAAGPTGRRTWAPFTRDSGSWALGAVAEGTEDSCCVDSGNVDENMA